MSVSRVRDRLELLFTPQSIQSFLPLKCHFEASFRRGDSYASIPLSAVAAADKKIFAICSEMDELCLTSPHRALSYIYEAAMASESFILHRKEPHILSPDHVCQTTTEIDRKDVCHGVWVRSRLQIPHETQSAVLGSHSTVPMGSIDSGRGLSDVDPFQGNMEQTTSFQVVFVPYCPEKRPRQLILAIEGNDYFLSVISRELGAQDAGRVIISRQIGKSQSGLRFYAPLEETEKRNECASLLSGQEICGDAILAKVGSTYREPMVGHRFWFKDFGMEEFFRLLAVPQPWEMYKFSREATLLARLPESFSGLANWRGDSPAQLLHVYCSQNKAKVKSLPRMTVFKVGKDGTKCLHEAGSAGHGTSTGLGLWSCNLKLDMLESCWSFDSRAYQSIRDAENCCCFQAVRHIQSLYSGQTTAFYWNGITSESRFPEKWQIRYRGFSSLDLPPPRSLVTIRYCVRWHSNQNIDTSKTPGPPFQNVDGYWILESLSTFEFELGSGAVSPPLDQVVSSTRPGQVASVNVIVPHSWHFDAVDAVYSPGGHEVEVECELLSYILPKEEKMESAFFSPSLGKQRMRAAMDLITRLGAKSVVDLGCGSGALLKLLVECQSVNRIAGVDISRKALTGAQKAVLSSLSQIPQPSSCPAELALYDWSAACVHPALKGFDFAALIEVIEHLDPEPLQQIGDSILGGLRPKTLLVSTPNVEFNPILQQRLDPESCQKAMAASLRNDDHRFEWTRSEFRNWAVPLAERHGYEVSFTGVGGSETEEPGFACQMAVFHLQGSGLLVVEPFHFVGHNHCAPFWVYSIDSMN